MEWKCKHATPGRRQLAGRQTANVMSVYQLKIGSGIFNQSQNGGILDTINMGNGFQMKQKTVDDYHYPWIPGWQHPPEDVSHNYPLWEEARRQWRKAFAECAREQRDFWMFHVKQGDLKWK